MHSVHVFADAERYDRHAGRLAARLYAKVVADAAASGLADGARVLDAGTGPGRIPRDLAMVRPAWTVDAVDLEPRMIDFARRQDTQGRVTFAVGDVAALPYPDETFDLIVSSISQHHWGDVEGGIRDLRRVLRPGGRLWIYDARWALRRALRAAEKTFDSVRMEPVAVGHWPLSLLVSRLSARA